VQSIKTTATPVRTSHSCISLAQSTMPIYEEKLISPLALRFTQEHIRTTFRDGRVVADTTGEIQAQPSTSEEYDLVLEAPFPQIEIIRWGHSDEDGQGSHWFTLDNRRLYCLQRAALKLWPQRVAAKVEILYADPGSVKRKYDSTTLGESVTVSDSCKEAPLFRFDWRLEAETLEAATMDARAQRALCAISRDDARCDVDDLPDVMEDEAEPDSIIARALAFERALVAAAAVQAENGAQKGDRALKVVRCPTPSTSATSDDSDGTPRAQWKASSGHRGRRSDYDLHAERAIEEINSQLRAPHADGRLRIRCWNERFGQQLGSLRKFIEAQQHLYILTPEGQGKFKVCEVLPTEEDSAENWSLTRLPLSNWEWDNIDVATATKQAVAEIRKQLKRQGGIGDVRIGDWNGRFSAALGPFKGFVRSRPQDFSIAPGYGQLFKVALA